MHIRCERDALSRILTIADRGTARNDNSRPVLTSVRLEAVNGDLVATGTDLDLTIQVRGPVDVLTEGVALLPGRLAVEVVKTLQPGAVEIDVVDGVAELTAGRTQISLRLISGDDYPILAEPAGNAVKVSSALLAEALGQVVEAANNDETRMVYSGVLLAAEGDGIRLVATDTFRLAMRDLPGTSMLERGQQVVVPSRSLKELNRLLASVTQDVTVRLGERDVVFELEVDDLHVQLRTHLIAMEFPNYRAAIPVDHPNRMVVDRQKFLDAVNRVKPLIEDRRKQAIKLTQRAGSLELSATSATYGEAHAELDASYDGDELVLGFNPDYLIDGLEAAEGEEVVLETKDGRQPVILRSADNAEFFYLLMPRLL